MPRTELANLVAKNLAQIESLQVVKEWAASVGIELPLNLEANVAKAVALVVTVLDKPVCHPKLIGTSKSA